MSKVSNFTFIFNLKLDNAGASGGVSLINKRAKAAQKPEVGHFTSLLAEEGNQEALINHPRSAAVSSLSYLCYGR